MTMALNHLGIRSSVVDIATETLALFSRHIRHLRRTPEKIVWVSMNPLVMLVVLGYVARNFIVVPGSGDYQEYILAGCLGQVGLASIGPSAIGVATDLRSGLMDRLRSLPISRVSVLLGRTVSDLVLAMLTVVLVTLAGLALGWRPQTEPLSVLAGFALLLAYIYTMLWLGVLLGLLMTNVDTIEAVSSTMLVTFSFLSNAFLSADGLPDWIRPIAAWNPVSSVVAACRTLWGNPVSTTADNFPAQHPIMAALGSIAILLAIIIPLSARAFRSATSR
jgi:ABC-2 type transport system permease protein